MRDTHFGAELRRLRENHLSYSADPALLVDVLTRNGYPITPPAYSAIESGDTLPGDFPRFLAALTAPLSLSQPKITLLVRRAAYDILSRELGADSAYALYAYLLDDLPSR